MSAFTRWAKRPDNSFVSVALATRSLPLVGRRHKCPCCGWRFRTFTRGGLSMRSKVDGYCPRCNSKARHRWLWLLLEHHELAIEQQDSVLHVAPAHSTERALRARNLDSYQTSGRDTNDHRDLTLDIGSPAPLGQQFDVVLCIHVLEHVADDRAAMAGLFSLVRPGGRAMVGVPVRQGRETFEDPSITSPADRREAFGEPDHHRWYGPDIAERLTQTGFEVTAYFTDDEPAHRKAHYGLKDGEGLFVCVRKD